jgi:glycosyltransferase involved in cell wall biosynthesis
MTQPSASVIVPTYRRPDDVEACLQSLLSQEVANFEVIVVDNAPDESLRRRLEPLLCKAEHVRYVHEPRLGVHNARHSGARHAASDLLLYVDDDAVCTPGWVRAYVEAFATDPSLAAAAGPVSAKWDEPPEAWLRRVATEPPFFCPFALIERDSFDIERRGMFFSVNMAIRKRVLLEAGGFNPESFGARWLGNGESGLNRKLWALGLKIGWTEEARVLHRVSRDRMRVEYLLEWARKNGAADAYSAYHPEIPAWPRLIGDVLVDLARATVSMSRLRRHRDRLSPEAIGQRMAVVASLAQARYTTRLLYSQSLRRLVARENWVAEP